MQNRQNGRRRRGGGGNSNPRPMGMASGGQNNNRLEVRVRGNAHQLLEKYKQLARDAHQAGDRVASEYYLQHADHYFRVLNDSRIRQEEMRARRGVFDPFEDDAAGMDGDEGEAQGDEQAEAEQRQPQAREQREPREQREQREPREQREQREPRDQQRGERRPRTPRPVEAGTEAASSIPTAAVTEGVDKAPRKRRRRRSGKPVEGAVANTSPNAGNVQAVAQAKRALETPAPAAVATGKDSLISRIGRGLKSLVTRGPSRQH